MAHLYSCSYAIILFSSSCNCLAFKERNVVVMDDVIGSEEKGAEDGNDGSMMNKKKKSGEWTHNKLNQFTFWVFFS